MIHDLLNGVFGLMLVFCGLWLGMFAIVFHEMFWAIAQWAYAGGIEFAKEFLAYFVGLF